MGQQSYYALGESRLDIRKPFFARRALQHYDKLLRGCGVFTFRGFQELARWPVLAMVAFLLKAQVWHSVVPFNQHHYHLFWKADSRITTGPDTEGGHKFINTNKNVIPVVTLIYEMLIVSSPYVPRTLLGSMLLWRSCWPITFTSKILSKYLITNRRKNKASLKKPLENPDQIPNGILQHWHLCTSFTAFQCAYVFFMSIVKNVCIHAYKWTSP